MMQVRFRGEAAADLRAITAYYDELAPDAVQPILADIRRAIDRLVAFPRLGMQVPERAFRRIVTRKYHFKIAYEVQEGAIVILGIFRYQARVA